MTSDTTGKDSYKLRSVCCVLPLEQPEPWAETFDTATRTSPPADSTVIAPCFARLTLYRAWTGLLSVNGPSLIEVGSSRYRSRRAHTQRNLDVHARYIAWLRLPHRFTGWGVYMLQYWTEGFYCRGGYLFFKVIQGAKTCFSKLD